MKAYVGTDIVLAEPGDFEGVSGYDVVYPGGEEGWMTKEEFEIQYREITEDEADLVVDSLIDDEAWDDEMLQTEDWPEVLVDDEQLDEEVEDGAE